MITELGKSAILVDLARGLSFAEFMTFGIDNTAAAVTDERLGFEIYRAEVDLFDYDTVASQVKLRATIPTELHMDIYEVGLLINDDVVDDLSPSSIISYFDSSEADIWSGYTSVDDSVTRSGVDSFRLDVAASGSEILLGSSSPGQFADFAPDDTFALAYNSITGVPDSVEVKFLVDASNYRSYTFTPASGFNVERWTKSNFTETGIAGWDDFTSTEITVTAGGASTSVVFEGLRHDPAVSEEGEILVARYVDATPIEKKGTAEIQVEYTLDVAFN